MSKFFGKTEIDKTFVDALEKRLVAVYQHENKREWRGIVWPMASFGAVLLLVVLILGRQYWGSYKVRTLQREFDDYGTELNKIQSEIDGDTEMIEAIDYMGM